MEDFRENMKMGVDDYLKSLEAELIKIQVFQRELPLCFELVSQAIEGCKKRMKSENGVVDYFHEEQNQQQLESDDCSDQTSSEDGPVLEEFIPIKKRCSFSDESQNNSNNNKIEKSGKKSDWLRSAQLWNQATDPPLNKEQVVEVKKNCGAFKPFIKDVIQPSFVHDISPSSPIATAAASSSAGTHSGGSRKEDKDRHDPGRKQRRCWSPELHRRFLNALQQLGGAHVATPKQIREFMKVDGLTNDEVKSHLQKYRLHTRRPSPGTNNNSNAIQQTPQCVAVGGLWAQPQMEGGSVEQGKNNVVVNLKQNTTSLSEEIRSGRRCTSPQASSSSTHTIAASPIY